MLWLNALNPSSSIASLLEANDLRVTHWTANDGRSALLFDYRNGMHRVVVLPSPDGKRFDYTTLPPEKE